MASIPHAAEANGSTVDELAPAKLNLALHVRHRRTDGYHAIETLFAFCRDGDRVSVARAERDSFALSGPFASALAGEGDNLVTRAAQAFAAAMAVDGSHAITLDKRLPVASGIGGGSADAAATLRALARLHGVAVDDPRLVTIAAGLGADVPACLLGRTAIGSGRGDDLIALESMAGMPVLLVNPGVAVSTAAVFGGWDGIDRGALKDGTAWQRARAGRNDLTAPAAAVAPVIGEVLAWLEDRPGTTLVRMSGSGATCFALFEYQDQVRAAAYAARKSHPGWWCLESTLV